MIIFFTYLNMILILLTAIVVVFSKDPIQSVLCLVLLFILTAILLFLIGAEFLAILLITVYVGAIAILFLFVVMLLNLRMVELYSSFYYHIPIGAFIGLLFFCLLIFILNEKTIISSHLFLVNNYYCWTYYVFLKANLNVLGEVLYNYYADLFLVIGLILFSAMLGVIVLTVDYDYRNNDNVQYNAKVKRVNIENIIWENINILGKVRQYPWWLYLNEEPEFELPEQVLNWDHPFPEFHVPRWVTLVTFGYVRDDS